MKNMMAWFSKAATSAGGEHLQAPALRPMDGALAVAVACLCFLIYLPTLGNSLLLEDDGLFLAAGHHLGIAHPPGYPFYTLLLWAFMKLPFATPALAGHALSAVLGALGCGVLYICGRLIGVAAGISFGAAIFFGVQEHVWSQAIRTEVYSLNYLLIFALLALALYVQKQPQARAYWFMGAGLVGLSMAHHWPLFVLAVPGICVLLWPVRHVAFRHILSLALISLGTAALFYGWMVWRSLALPPISFSGPIEGVGELWSYFMREDFAGVDNSESAGWRDRLKYYGWFLGESFMSFTPLGGVLSLLGIWALTQSHRLISIALLCIWFSQGFFLLMLLNFDFDVYNVGIFRPYPLAAYGIQALWIAVGAHWALQKWQAHQARGQGQEQEQEQGKASIWALGGAVAICVLAAFSFLAFKNYRLNDQSTFTFPRDFATYVSGKLDPGGFLLLNGDFATATFSYHEFVEPQFDRVEFSNLLGLVIAGSAFENARNEERQRRVLGSLLETGRPVYTLSISSASTLCPTCGLQIDGFVTRLVPDAAGSLTVTWGPEDEAMVAQIIDMKRTDSWVAEVQKNWLLAYGRIASYLLINSDEKREETQRHLDKAQAGPWIQLGAVRRVLEDWDLTALPDARNWMRQIDARMFLEPRTKESLAIYYNQRGGLLFIQGQQDEARQSFIKSLEVWDHPDNEARILLEQMQNL